MTSGHCGTNPTRIWAGFSLSGRSGDKEQRGRARAASRHDGRSEPSIHPVTERASGRGVAKATVNTVGVVFPAIELFNDSGYPGPEPSILPCCHGVRALRGPLFLWLGFKVLFPCGKRSFLVFVVLSIANGPNQRLHWTITFSTWTDVRCSARFLARASHTTSV